MITISADSIIHDPIKRRALYKHQATHTSIILYINLIDIEELLLQLYNWNINILFSLLFYN